MTVPLALESTPKSYVREHGAHTRADAPLERVVVCSWTP